MIPTRPVAGAPRPYRFPDFEHRRLANGLGVWLVPLPDRELVSVHLLADAGAASEDEAQAGRRRADRTAAGHRHGGSTRPPSPRRRSASGSRSAASRRGTTPAPASPRSAASSTTAWRCWPRWSARRASTSGEFDRLRAERLNDILQARADPGRLADESFLREVFADEVPYGGSRPARPETVEALSVEDARALPRRAITRRTWRTSSSPARSDRRRHAPPSSATSRLVRQRPGAPHVGRPSEADGIVLVDRPGSVQSELRVGHLGIDRESRATPGLAAWRRCWAESSGAVSTAACARSWGTPTGHAAPSTRGAR